MAEFTNFSFKNASMIFGVEEIKGFGEGDDVVTITPIEQFTKLTGAKGDVVRTQTSDNSCAFTVKLLQTSSSNKILMAQFNLDRETGTGVLPAIFQDKDIGETYTINNAWIIKYPDIVRGANPNEMLWSFEGDYLTGVIV